ncbi:MAG: 3-methyladenine DNA glycosylase [Rubrivivax sp. SCN 71-131]|nr:MAG: 3-methyladenine DNA glycosylase [Rubrivivax sp. SCN 71-131]
MTLDYPWLHETVRKRFESDAAMEAFLPQPLSAAELEAQGDDRYLSAMTQRVFQAGMQHSMVDAKWPAFEEAFAGFQPKAMAALTPHDIERFMQDARLIRHRAKLETIPKNAAFVLDVAREHGSFARFIAQRGARLGGRSAAGFLRLVGKDTFLLTSHVVERLQLAGVIEGTPSSRRNLQAVQDAFNALQQASGRPLSQLSAMLALSIHPMF